MCYHNFRYCLHCNKFNSKTANIAMKYKLSLSNEPTNISRKKDDYIPNEFPNFILEQNGIQLSLILNALFYR